MDNHATFVYTYRGKRNPEVLSIRKKYLPYDNNQPAINLLTKSNLYEAEGVITMNQNEQNFLVQKIRTQYTEKEHTGLAQLKALDSKVKRPANVFAYIFGSISAIIMGCGMSLVMTDIGATVGIAEPMLPGIVIGVVGMLLAIINYPIHKSILNRRKQKYASQIMALSDKIMEK